MSYVFHHLLIAYARETTAFGHDDNFAFDSRGVLGPVIYEVGPAPGEAWEISAMTFTALVDTPRPDRLFGTDKPGLGLVFEEVMVNNEGVEDVQPVQTWTSDGDIHALFGQNQTLDYNENFKEVSITMDFKNRFGRPMYMVGPRSESGLAKHVFRFTLDEAELQKKSSRINLILTGVRTTQVATGTVANLFRII